MDLPLLWRGKEGEVIFNKAPNISKLKLLSLLVRLFGGERKEPVRPLAEGEVLNPALSIHRSYLPSQHLPAEGIHPPV